MAAGPRCLNCGTDRLGPYCHACGQGEVDPAAPVSALVREAVADGLSWDHRLWRTLRVLLTRPGALAQAWAAGRRAPFVPPVRLYLLLGAALLALSAVGRWLADDPSPTPRAEPRPTTQQAAYLIGKAVGTLGLNALLLLVPLVGFATYVLFKERRPALAGHLVLASHVASAALVVLIAWRAATVVVLGLGAEAGLPGWAGDAAVAGALLGVGAYASLGARRFLGVGRAGGAAVGALVVVIPPVLLLGSVVAVSVVLTLG